MSRVPRIRFKGFEEDWEQRKLGDICQITMGQSPDGSTYSETTSDYILVQGNADLKDGWVYPRIWTTQKTKMAYVGDLIMSVRAPAGTMGKTYYDVVIGRGVAGIKGSEFIYQALVKMDSGGYWKILAAGSTFESINSDVVNGAELMVTENVDEQNRIGDCFASIDHLITLHQRKLEKLKIIKKSMLENFFPQNGEKTPKIRFSGFTKDWEQRKFGELFLEKRDKTEREDEDVLLSCAITGIYLNSELFSHFRGTSNIGYLKIKKNDLILSAQNLHLGNANVNLVFEHGIISPAYKVYELNKCDQYFVQSWVKKDSTKDFFLNATTEGASQCRKNIDWYILNNQLIVIPSLYEQIRIGKLFDCLNHLITLHQSKLDKLQKIKKSMLESMFV